MGELVPGGQDVLVHGCHNRGVQWDGTRWSTTILRWWRPTTRRLAPAGLFAQRGGSLVFLSLSHERETCWLAQWKQWLWVFSPQEVNVSYNVGQRKVNHFQRGHSIQFLQILAPHKYVLSNLEKDNLRVMGLDFNPTMKFDTYCWGNDFVWY